VLSGSDVVVKLMKKGTNSPDVCARIFYVRAGTTYSIKNIPEGMYYLKIAYGSDWRQTVLNDQCIGKFVYHPSYELGQEVFSYNIVWEKEDDNGNVNYSIPSYELTIGTISNLDGEFKTFDVDEKKFNE